MTITSTVRRYCRCIYNIHKLKNSISANNDLRALFSDWVMQRGDGRREASSGEGERPQDQEGEPQEEGEIPQEEEPQEGEVNHRNKTYTLSLMLYLKQNLLHVPFCILLGITYLCGCHLERPQTTCAIHAYCEQYTNDVMT